MATSNTLSHPTGSWLFLTLDLECGIHFRDVSYNGLQYLEHTEAHQLIETVSIVRKITYQYIGLLKFTKFIERGIKFYLFLNGAVSYWMQILFKVESENPETRVTHTHPSHTQVPPWRLCEGSVSEAVFRIFTVLLLLLLIFAKCLVAHLWINTQVSYEQTIGSMGSLSVKTWLIIPIIPVTHTTAYTLCV